MLKSKFLKSLSITIATMVSISTFAGCSKKSEVANEKGKEKPVQEKVSSEPVKLDFFLVSIDSQTADDFLMKKVFKEKFNADVKFILNSNQKNYNEKLNLLIAANELPDIMCPMTAEMAKDLGMKGALVPVDKYLDKMPNFSKHLKSDKEIYASIVGDDGHVYNMPLYTETFDFKRAGIIRADILKEMNLKEPETIKDLHETLKAIKQKYPDSIGFTNRNAMSVIGADGFGGYYNTADEMFYNKKTDKWEYGPLGEGFKEMIFDLNKFQKDGLLDKDFFIANTKQWQEKLSSGQGIFTMDFAGRAGMETESFKKLHPDKPDYELKIINPLTSESNKQKRIARASSISTMTAWGISSKTKNLDTVLKIADFMYSDEGAQLAQWGEKDVQYKEIEGGVKVYNTPNGDSTEIRKKYGVNVDQILRIKKAGEKPAYPKVQEAIEKIRNNKGIEIYETNYKMTLSFTPEESQEMTDIRANLKTYVDEQISKFILGLRPLTEYDKFVKDIEKFKAKRLEEIYAKSYNKYKANLNKIK